MADVASLGRETPPPYASDEFGTRRRPGEQGRVGGQGRGRASPDQDVEAETE